MKKRYLKSMKECQNSSYQDENEENSVIEKALGDEIILDTIYRLQLDLAEYITKEDYYKSKAEITHREILRLEKLLS